MAVHVYKGKGFRFGSERRMLGEFVQSLLERYAENDDFHIVSEVSANGAAIDLLLLSSRALVIVDFKELTAIRPEDGDKVQLACRQNGPWEYGLPGQKKERMGGHENTKSPYDQLERIRYEFAHWLVEHSQEIFNNQWSKGKALDRISAWVALKPGFDGDLSHLDLPWNEIGNKHNWFRVIPFRELAWEFNTATDFKFSFSALHIQQIIELLGATPYDLDQILPVPLPRRTGLFSNPPVVDWLVDREKERQSLLAFLESEKAKVAALRGLGGVGKTWLAGWLAEVARASGRRLYWINCADREVTDESFLAALAGELNSPQVAGFLLDKDRYTLNERLDAAVEPLTKEPSLIVFNDFHRISRHKGIDSLLTYLVLHARGLKILLTTREHPACLDHPRWRPGVAQEILVEGLPMEAVAEFIAADLKADPTREQLTLTQERTSGNPYAIRLLLSLARRYGWSEQVEKLPLFRADKTNESDQWFESLLEVLSDGARQLALKLSAFRTELNHQIIRSLCPKPEEAQEWTLELVGSSILQKTDHAESYIFHEFIRDYLYERLPVDRKIKVHEIAARYYSQLGDTSQDPLSQGEAYFEAVHHLEASQKQKADKAQEWKDVELLAAQAFDCFSNAGDWDMAQSAALSGLQAAQKLGDPVNICRWLVRIATWEVDREQIQRAGKHLSQALASLPKPNPKMPELKRAGLQKLEARLYIQKGRLAYLISDFAAANDYLDRALELAQATQDCRLEADCLVRIGRIERQKGQYERAEKHFLQARELASNCQETTLFVESTSHLGLLARKKGDLDKAQEHFQQALDLGEKAGDKLSIQINLGLLADLEKRRGNYASAAAAFRKCLAIAKEIHNGKGIRINMGQLAECLMHLGEFEEAARLLDEIEQHAEDLGDVISSAWTLLRKGKLLKMTGEIEAGNTLILKGKEMMIEIGNEDYLQDFDQALGSVQLGLFTPRKPQPPAQTTLPGFDI